jgi:hypothetical protein
MVNDQGVCSDTMLETILDINMIKYNPINIIMINNLEQMTLREIKRKEQETREQIYSDKTLKMCRKNIHHWI